jgi:DNA-binding MarR family transcriptional regulator
MDPTETTQRPEYALDEQVGFLLRLAMQRHLSIFAARIPALTPTQFTVLAKLSELGPTSQNALGRATAMDAATMKGVADRLREKGLVAAGTEDGDRRRLILSLTAAGAGLFAQLAPAAHAITAETLAPLTPAERQGFADLLRRLG